MGNKRRNVAYFLSEFDRIVKHTTGSGLADLVSDAITAAIKEASQSQASSSVDALTRASIVLGVRPDAQPQVIEAARRVLLRQVNGGDEAIGGDEARAKQINAAADTLLGKGAS